MTGITSPLPLNPAGPTVLIGYEPGAEAFAGFDPTKHITFKAGSSSVQVPITIVHAALQDGFSFFRKGNDEIVIGFRPDQFLAYALNCVLLHEQGVDAATVELLTKAASFQEIEIAELRQIPPERQRVVRVVSRLSRNADFRRKVTLAYDRKCAVTRMQLRLVEAAHILPVGAEDSTDEVSNGLCLSPTYHRAFDRGLIYLGQDLVMRINPDQEATLVQKRLNGGMPDFKTYLGKKIHLPADRRQWPDLELIRKSNEHRHIPL